MAQSARAPLAPLVDGARVGARRPRAPNWPCPSRRCHRLLTVRAACRLRRKPFVCRRFAASRRGARGCCCGRRCARGACSARQRVGGLDRIRPARGGSSAISRSARTLRAHGSPPRSMVPWRGGWALARLCGFGYPTSSRIGARSARCCGRVARNAARIPRRTRPSSSNSSKKNRRNRNIRPFRTKEEVSVGCSQRTSRR
jgi:hypothetical protein